MARDVYAEVTDQIVEALERGTAPWRRPWRERGLQRSLQSDRPYRGINQLLLQVRQQARGYRSPHWTTYRAARKAGGHVRRGERGTTVVFWRMLRVRDEASDNPEPTEPRAKKRIPFARLYTVFNTDQTEGLELSKVEAVDAAEFEPVDKAEWVIAGMPSAPAIAHGARGASYDPALDRVSLPAAHEFEPPEGYYATAFHELTHSTAHESRLDRDVGSHRFGSADYSREELVAELGAAMLCATVGLAPATIDNAAAYIAGWLRALRGDKRLVLVAAGQGQRAADYILDVEPQVDREDGEGEQAERTQDSAAAAS